MAGSGWCTHPKRQLSSDVRILVRPAELACRNAWGVDVWEDKDRLASDAITVTDPPRTATPPEAPTQVPAAQASFDDEITSVVSSEIHRSRTDQDLNDRVVEQTTIRLDDHTTTEGDDRFHLLSRGGRDSVGQARQRHLRRRQGAPLLPGDDEANDEEAPEPIVDASADSDFVPDDYVEQEAPSHEAPEEESEEGPQDDDVVLSQESALGSPRSRRLRRAREQAQRPKFDTGTEIGPDVDASLARMVDTAAHGPRTHFAPIAEPSSSVELPGPRQQPAPSGSSQNQSGTEQHTRPPLAEENRYDRVVKRAEGIKAAARAEREERLSHERREALAPLPTKEPGPHPRTRFGAPTPPPPEERNDLYQELFPDDERSSASPRDPSRPERGEMHTRRVVNGRVTGFHDADEMDATLVGTSSPDSTRHEARGNWWRGFFHRRTEQQVSRDEYDEWEDDVEDAYIASSDDDWDIDEREAWNNRYDDQGSGGGEIPDEASDDQDGQGIVASYATANRFGEDCANAEFEPLDLQNERNMNAYRDRLFISASRPQTSSIAASTERPIRRTPITLSRPQSEAKPEPVGPTSEPIPQSPAMSDVDVADLPTRIKRRSTVVATLQDQEPEPSSKPVSARQAARAKPQVEQPEPWDCRLAPEGLLRAPADAWFEPETIPEFDIRAVVEHGNELLDMTITVSPDVPRACATCRSYRMSEQGERGWCTNNWAFTHRQMVNATDLACQSTIGCWWLPDDEEVWLAGDEPTHGATPRIDRLIAQLDPVKRAVGR